MGKRKKNGKRKRRKLTAKRADIHDLYQRAVQDPPTDIQFIQRIYKKEHGRKAQVLREDFCGTALMCAEWVKGKPQRRAIGIDLHGPTLDWGRKHNFERLNDDKKRILLLQQNVLDPTPEPADITVAFNFSYCVFKTRPEMLAYCQAARDGLSPGGAFILDIHGGSENTTELSEDTKLSGFTYVWDQRAYDAINGNCIRYIHFEFRDGTRIKKAFTYDWRLWTLPELREILDDAGFRRVDVYWEGATKKGEGNGVFRRVVKAEQEESWIAYVVAWL